MITIGIINWNTSDLLETLITNILAETSTYKDFSIEIIVIDNASSDNSVYIMETKFTDIKLIKNKINQGFTKAANQIIDIMKGEFLLLVNTDIILLPRVILDTYEFIKSHKKVGACGCQLLDEKGEIHLSAREINNLSIMFIEQSPLGRWLIEKMWKKLYFGKIRKAGFVSGAFIILRKEAIDEVGKFDENYYLYVQEMDWCYRAQKLGWEIFYFPKTSAIHLGGKSTVSIPNKALFQLFSDRYIFFKKHFGITKATIYKVMIYFIFFSKAVIFSIFSPLMENDSKKLMWIEMTHLLRQQ
ncbi:MAG: glycosyltransferase family 2 protein [bacterium]|nr:glycosyltransferase family 2 protein [bacterium]